MNIVLILCIFHTDKAESPHKENIRTHTQMQTTIINFVINLLRGNFLKGLHGEIVM